MHFLPTFLIAGIVLFTRNTKAFKVPENATDGDYVAYHNAKGSEVHLPTSEYDFGAVDITKAIEFPLKHRSAKNVRAKEGDLLIYCGCGLTMDHNACDGAVGALQDQFRTSKYEHGAIAPGMSWYSIRDGVVAFACHDSRAQYPLLINANTYGSFLGRLTKRCGWYVPGAFANLVENLLLKLGYMNHYSSLDFCTDSTSDIEGGC